MDDQEQVPELLDVIDDPSKLHQLLQNEGFSHTMMVTLAYKKCLDTSAKEMKKGYWETKSDKFGNVSNHYNPDSRQEFISCVETLLIIMSSDLDETANNKINAIKKSLAQLYKELVMQEETAYNKLPLAHRVRVPHIKGMLSQENIYYQSFLNASVYFYRDIFKELELLLKRSVYMQKQLNTA